VEYKGDKMNPVEKILSKGKQGGTLEKQINFHKKLLSEEE